MKIAILTQPLGHNYGGLLQAYALQTYFKNLGYEVETLDRRSPEVIIKVAKKYIRAFIKLLLGRIESIPTSKRQAYVLSELASFRDRRLIMSPKISSEEALREYYRLCDIDIFVVGSDQVWRPRYSPSIMNFYLDFLEDMGSSAKRIAYAASFGVDDWEYTPEMTQRCKQLAQKFDAISVRESSAIGLCEDKLGVTAQWVVDPTLLLDVSDYKKLIKEKCDDNPHAGCVLSYILDSEPEKKSIANMVGKSLGKTVFSIKPEYTVGQVPANELDKCKFPSVESWLQAFNDASFVVTDSFHGTIFSILFNKPFITIGNSSRGMARFESLLSQFDLKERMVLQKDERISYLVRNNIDWIEVNRKHIYFSAVGKNFIENHISLK